MSVSTRVPILTASPERASAIVRTPGAVTAHPFQFQKLAGIIRRTGNTNGSWCFTYHLNPTIGVEYASHSDGTIRNEYNEISWTISKKYK
jgi:hypothetical protein